MEHRSPLFQQALHIINDFAGIMADWAQRIHILLPVSFVSRPTDVGVK